MTLNYNQKDAQQMKKQIISKIQLCSTQDTNFLILFNKALQQYQNEESRQTKITQYLQKDQQAIQKIFNRPTKIKKQQDSKQQDSLLQAKNKKKYKKKSENKMAQYLQLIQNREPEAIKEPPTREFIKNMMDGETQRIFKLQIDSEYKTDRLRKNTQLRKSIIILDNSYYFQNAILNNLEVKNINCLTPNQVFTGISYELEDEEEFVDMQAIILGDQSSSEENSDADNESQSNFLVGDESEREFINQYTLKINKWVYNYKNSTPQIEQKYRIMAPFGTCLPVNRKKKYNLCTAYPHRLQQIRELCKKSPDKSTLKKYLKEKFQVDYKNLLTFLKVYVKKKRVGAQCFYEVLTEEEYQKNILEGQNNSQDSDDSINQDSRMTNDFRFNIVQKKVMLQNQDNNTMSSVFNKNEDFDSQ